MRLASFRWSLLSMWGLALVLNVGCMQSNDKHAESRQRASSPSESAASAPTRSAPMRGIESKGASIGEGSGRFAETADAEAASSEESAAGAPTSPAFESTPSDSPTTPPAKPDSRPAEDRARDSEAEETAAQRTIQSGLLTAGSFDDVEKFSDYQKFLTETLQKDAGERFPRWAIGQRVTIQVQTEQGQPLGNARIEIRAVSTGQQPQAEGAVLTTLVTGSDGRALLLTGEDKVAGHEKLSVRVVAAGAEPVEQNLEVKNALWNIHVAAATSQLPKQLDLALVVDTTGSMGDELEYLKVEIDSIAAAVKKMFPEVDQRFALIVYRDAGDQYVSRSFDFTSSLADFRSTLASQSADGGGDYPEAMHLALEQADKLSWRKDDTARVMFLVGDAPPHEQYARRTLEAGLALRQQGVRIYPLGASGVALEAEFIMRAMALASVGQYLFLTDHSGIGNAHAAPHVPEFLVERLDRLMIRMIASELAGKRLVPTEVIAIERGAGSEAEGLPPEPQQQPAQLRQTSSTLPPTSNSGWLADSSRWLLFGGLILGVFLLDAWDKYRQK